MFFAAQPQPVWFQAWKNASRRFLPFLLGILLVGIVSNTSISSTPQKTEILWDTYGIPHIYGHTVQGAFEAFGWAQMQSHGNLLLRLYGQARGKAAEYWGEDYLDSDQWVLSMNVPQRAKVWYEAQSPAFRSYLDAFAAGINAYGQAHPELIDDQVKVVLPISSEDVLAHLQRVLLFTFVVNPGSVAKAAPTPSPAASNGWAIAPKHSASGKALLLANPHLPWGDLFLWYEAQMAAPGIDTYGATLVGIPALAIAFNDYLGWTHTVNTYDGWDAYELTLKNNGYVFDGKVRPFETTNYVLNIKQNDGSLKQQPFSVKSSVHGPVVRETGDKAIALRVVGLESSGIIEQWWEMASAKNLNQFQKALQRLQLPMFTVIYADRDGHIMHLFNGLVPRRTEGDFADWKKIIPGDTSKTLWTQFHPYPELPKVVDPASGWLQNANDPPWTTTFPSAIKAENYPSYMAPAEGMDFRAQRSARMLAEDQQISFEEMIAYKHSTYSELADRILDDLIQAAQQEEDQLTREAAQVLATWDKKTDGNSKGAVLFYAWVETIDLDTLFKTPWDQKAPLTTPDGLANPKQAVKDLRDAATQVKKAYNKLDIPWGEVFRLQAENIDFPSNGGDGDQGIFRVVNYAPTEAGRFQAVAGDSYVAAIEFSQPIKAQTLITYGNASQPNSPHIGDQLPLFARQQLRPVWRSRAEITEHLEDRTIF